ncbi:hypothetical protein P43SY_010675 [Pythium insidiosum]|uniref:Uncharacterized protein n=1 Tax=Pythium insidiosum TaxID=114742 RepID=A0AAD5Q4D2_PYTIN|nr:hypothetical protein P43SY_010675 [Pythium insidiosum]
MPSLLTECSEILVDNGTVQSASEYSESLTALAVAVLAALAEDVTALNSRTGFVRAGYHPELDGLPGYQQEKSYFSDIPLDEHSRLQRRATEQALDSTEEGVGIRAPSFVIYRDILEATLELARIENEISATLRW